MPSELSKLMVVIGADTSEFQEKIKGMSANLKKVGVAMTAAGAAITGVMALSIKAAADEQKGIEQLRMSMRNMGLSYDDVQGSLEAWINTQQQKTSISDSDQRESLSKLILMTGDMAKAQDLLTVAMDMSRGTGKELSSVTDTLGYAIAGNWGMVNRMLPAIASLETEEEKWAFLREKFAGQAESYGATVSGQMELMKNNMGDVMEMIGSTFLPILTGLSKKIMPVVEGIKAWIDEHPKLVKAIVLIVGALGALMMVVGPLLIVLPGLIASLPLLAGAFALLLGPVGLVIAAIAVLVAIGIIVWKNWDSITHDLILYWNRLVTAANTAFGFISEIINKYLIEPILAAWNLMKQFLAWIRSLGPKIGGGGKGGFFTVGPNWELIPAEPSEAYNPIYMQHGGIVSRPTLAVLGEVGPEAVIPLQSGEFFSRLESLLSGGKETPVNMYLDGEKVGEVVLRRSGERYAQLSHIGGLNR